MAYAAADETPRLMADWLNDFNALFDANADEESVLLTYQRAVGTVSLAAPDLLPEPERLDALKALLRSWWRPTLDLVAEAKGAK